MNPELPNSIRSALARNATVATHPSADVLTAFAEHTLSARENERVADHVARCLECREVLFLAGNADEQYVTPAEPAARPRSKWMPRVLWIPSGVAAVAIVGGILVQQYLSHERTTPKPAQVAQVAVQQQQPSLPIEPKSETEYLSTIAPEGKKPPHAPTTKPSEAGKVPHHASDMTAMKVASGDARASAAAGAPPDSAVEQSPGMVIGGATNGFKVTIPTQNGFAPSQQDSQTQSLAAGRMSAVPQAFMRQSSGNKTWRITPDGHLEHFSQTGWIGVLTDHSTQFRVVAVSGNGVWAGGSHGELFHSADGGEHWSQIALPVPSDRTNDAIAAIHFADLQHGIILTESGERYSTSDGGKNWQRE